MKSDRKRRSFVFVVLIIILAVGIVLYFFIEAITIWRVWLIALTASLYFVSKEFHHGFKSYAANALFVKNEPYLMIMDVGRELKQAKMRINDEQLDTLIYSVKKLEEKLAVESDFGYGEGETVNCENCIAQEIMNLSDMASHVENGNFGNNIDAMEIGVTKINELLRKRMELMKH